MRDYVEIAKAFADEAIADRYGKRHCKWIRLAAKRFKADLKRASKKRGAPFTFSEERAVDACEFVEMMPHVEGEWDSETLVLDPFQIFFTVQLFGFRNLDGDRRFTHALLLIARKNGKSAFASAILLYCFCCEGHVGPQVITAATTGDQARIVWKAAKTMVDKTPDLRDEFMLETFAHSIANWTNHGSFKPISARASTQDGLNPAAVCLDEIHAHKTHDLLNVLKSAAGARKNQLWLYVTTEGYESPGPWPETRRFAEQVMEGAVEADHMLALMFTLDEDDDEFSEAAWVKANPLMETNQLLLDAIRREAIEAKQMPGAAAEFRIKRCNRRSAHAGGWINLNKWRKLKGDIDLTVLEGYPCWGAIDLASTNDTTAWRLVWLVDGVYYTWGRFWVPEEAVAHRTQRGTVQYQPWVDAGYMQQTSGNVTDYAEVERDIVADWERFQPSVVAYDDWNATDLVNRLVDAGVDMVNFQQTPKLYHPAMQELERAYTSERLVHGGDPVLTWQAANIVARRDVNMNMAPDKRNSAEKIDGMCTLLMAIGVSISGQHRPSVYETRGIAEL